MGNTVVLKPASYTRLTALLFAEICAEAGLPPGVFNVVTGSGSFGSVLATHPLVDKVGFTGSTEVRMRGKGRKEEGSERLWLLYVAISDHSFFKNIQHISIDTV